MVPVSRHRRQVDLAGPAAGSRLLVRSGGLVPAGGFERIEPRSADSAIIGNHRTAGFRVNASADRVAPGVKAIIVLGAAHVKATIEAAGPHTVFQAVGVKWLDPGYSMCVAACGNARFRPLAATSRGARAGKPNPAIQLAMFAAAAIAGCITDMREIPDPRGTKMDKHTDLHGADAWHDEFRASSSCLIASSGSPCPTYRRCLTTSA